VNQEEATAGAFALSPFAQHAKLRSLAEAYMYCRRVTQRSSSNFYYAFRLLPTEQHNALCALYAFCRFMDDIADQPESSVSPGRSNSRTERLTELLNLWREELQRCYAGTPVHPISQALADTVRRFPIAQAHLSGIIDGVEMDLHRRCYQTFAELYDYCYHVASLVGLVCIEIFGYHNPCARDYAINLGVAFQLTNILRDVGEDAQRNRIYLPLEDLVRIGYGEDELRAGVYNPTFTNLMAFEGKRAREYYRRAVTHLAPEDRRSLAAAEAMRLIYTRLLDKIEAQHFKVFETRITLPTATKLGLALAAWTHGWLPFSSHS
jgi:phytoene synthase